jgi:hypothetical protein
MHQGAIVIANAHTLFASPSHPRNKRKTSTGARPPPHPARKPKKERPVVQPSSPPPDASTRRANDLTVCSTYHPL